MGKKFDKEKLKEDHNISYSKKVDELKFNEVIDDRYTNNVIDKYKKGHKKNKWFLWSGYLSILFGVVCFVTMVIVGIIFISSVDQLKELAVYGDYDFEKKKNQVIIACIVIPIIGILSVLIGLKITRFAHYTRDMLMQSSVVPFFIFLQFLFGGCIFSILTFIGYFAGRGMDYGAIYYNKIDGYSESGAKIRPEYKEWVTVEENIFIDDIEDKKPKN